RTLAGKGADLARDRLVVLAASRAEDRATADKMGSTTRSLTGASGSLLLPRLLVSARDESTRLGVRETEALVAQVRLNRLVHHRHVDGAVEQLAGKIEALALGATSGIGGCLQSRIRCFSHC